MRVVAYLRVSSTEQAQKGLGLPVQEQAVVDWARREGHELVEVFRDPGVSGTLALHERPGLRGALEAVKERSDDPEPVAGLVVARWDRLARETLIGLLVEQEFQRVGCQVISADGIGVDQTTRELFMVLAGAERRSLVARLRAGREAKAAGGGYAGGRPPLGYRAEDGALVEDERTADLVRWIFRRVARDGRTIRQVAAELNERGALSRKWDARAVHMVLKREAYKRGEAPIVDPRVFNKAQRMLAERRRHAATA